MSSRIVLVLNRFRKQNHMIGFDECRRALGDEGLETVRNDFKSALRSINFGKPLSEVAPMSGLRRDLRKLAEKVARKTTRMSKEANGK